MLINIFEKMNILLLIIPLVIQICYSNNLFELKKENEEIIEEITVNETTELIYEILSNTSYIFIIDNENYFYSFSSLYENIFYIKNEDNNTFEVRPNETFFEKGEKIYINNLKNLNETTIIKISPTPIYNELNSFETLKENQYFFIKSEKRSIAYFDSFDMNSKVYISESRQKKVLEDDKRINSKFYEIEPNKIYLIKNEIFDISVFKKYFYPTNLNETEIDINNNDKNFFYLFNNQSYIFNLESNKINKMIKLSSKTPNSKIKISSNNIDEVKELNSSSPYYMIDENFKGKLILDIEDDNAFIEFLYNYGEYEILSEEKMENIKINKSIEIIKIPFTYKSFEIKFKSDKNFKYSLSLGLTNNEKYYYSSKSNLKINSKNNEENLTYLAFFKNINLLKDEYLSLAINFEKDENQEIFISYRQFSQLDELMDLDISQEKCEKIIKSLQEAIELYVYLDIAQNPPDVGIPGYHHRKINLKEEIGNISTKNRKFYEFYQEIKTILNIVKDGHLEINSYQTPTGIQFDQYSVVMPFSYEIKEFKGEKRLFVKVRIDTIGLFDKEIQNFVRNHSEIPIKSINGMDPFDYIQNFTHFFGVKNVHGTFIQNFASISGYYLMAAPLNYTDLTQNEFEFEDNKIIRVSYIIIKPKEENKEFNRFFLRMLKKYKSLRLMPMINDIKEMYLLKKGIKKKLTKNEIKWDVIYKEFIYYMKCRVDHDKKVNVFVQNSLYMDNEIVYGKIFECAKLFHSNRYPIIIIEDRNAGGFPTQSYLMIQLFQMREVERSYSAMRFSEKFKKYNNLKDLDNEIFDPTTCKKITSIDNFTEVIDYYNYSGLNISHRRTNVFQELYTLSERKALNEFRKEYQNSPYLKRPTDIMIFTDGFSFSSASTLIKGFQNIGGAIIVGYFGNPKIKGIDLFDASQSDSGVMFYENSDISKNLEDLGFLLSGITSIEVFDDSYINPNHIPREYSFNPIDYRVDIYSKYSDDNYNDFIDKGKEIFKKFNEEGYCNFKNEKLLLHSGECITNLEHGYGGFKCGNNNKWDTDSCIPYYCDIGFSFDQSLKTCVRDCMPDWNAYFIFEDEFSKSYNIKKNETLELLTRNPNGLYYVFQASENYIEKCPKLCFLKGSHNLIINKEKNSQNDILLNVNSIYSDINIMSIKEENLFFDQPFLFIEQNMLIFHSNKEHILLFNNIFNEKENKIKHAKYNDKIKYQDILDINDEYFTDYSGDTFTLNKDETHIIYFNNNLEAQVHISINPVEINEITIPKEQIINYLYLKKGNTYDLEFLDSSLDIMLKLSRKTSNSVISIEDNNKVILNWNNLYYHNMNKKKFKFKVEDNDAILEFIYNLEEYSDIFDLEKLEFNLIKEINIIKIPKNYKNIDIEIIAGEFSEYSIYRGYSIPPFSHISNVKDENKMVINNFNFSIYEPYNENIKLMKDEYYIIMIRVFYGDLNVKINAEKYDNKIEDDDEDGLKDYEIALIVVGAVMFVILLIVIIFIVIRKRRLKDEKIEDKVNNMNERILE